MRSALAGTASNVVALKTTAAVPMSVTERMFHLLCGASKQQSRSHSVPKTQTRNLFSRAGTWWKIDKRAFFPSGFRIHITSRAMPELNAENAS
jgi:hypothetical protein